MKKFFFTAILIYAAAGFAQNLDFINQIGDKPTVTSEEAAQIFKGIDKSLPPDAARTQRLKEALEKYPKGNTAFTKGAAAFVTAKFIGVKSSIMFKIFKNERYAFRACVAEGFFSKKSGQSEFITGSEIIELAANISKRYGVE